MYWELRRLFRQGTFRGLIGQTSRSSRQPDFQPSCFFTVANASSPGRPSTQNGLSRHIAKWAMTPRHCLHYI